METIVSEIAKARMIKDVNDALITFGLFVSSIEFDASINFSVIIQLSAHNLPETQLSKNIAVPEGTAC